MNPGELAERYASAFLDTLQSNGDMELLPRVVAILRRKTTAQRATVTSAVELDAETRQRVEGSVRGRYGPEVQVRYEIDPELIGGLKIQVGDEVIDGSVAARLGELDGTLRRAN